MNTLRPSAKIVLTFIISFLVSYSLINLVISQMEYRELLIHKKEAKIIQQEIDQRFSLFLDVTLTIGQISSDYIYKQNKNDGSYGDLVATTIAEKKYILGLNQLNADGKIVNVYPKEENHAALGKVTQNLAELVASDERGEKYWFSPPFKLFQGGTGFVFYIPIHRDGKLLGWMAPVISSQLFFERFKTIEFFKEYDLVIKDELTGNVYFETGIPPKEGGIEEMRSKLRERSIVFQSWHKTTHPKFSLSFGWRFLICFLCGFFFALLMKFHLQKKKAFSRLDSISELLKLTSNEALSKLMDIQSEYLLTGADGFLSTEVVEKDVQSVTNLIEQIELLQNIAGSEQLTEENFEILPLLTEHLQEFRDVLKKKNVRLDLDSESFKEIKITGNKWLISNTVLKNALSYCVLIAKPEAKIKITHTLSPRECSTIFLIDSVYEEELYKAFKVERRLLVARNVMDFLNGKIVIQDDGTGGKILMLSIKL
jgi:hypothetical protein